MLPNVIENLRSNDPNVRIRTLHVLGRFPDVRPEVVAELERLLEDREVGQLHIPYRYGEVRLLAGEALAIARARSGDLRLVALAAVPPALSADQMAPFRERAGIPAIGGPPPVERYVLLRDGGFLPHQDYVFDPREYVEE